jgi:hypothetical protein
MLVNKIYEQSLTEEAKKLFSLFRKFKNFYLAGGTALALQIGHRISADFDFFSEKKLPTGLLQKVHRVFSNAAIKTTYSAPGQLNILINNIKTTFFYYPYPVVNPLIEYKKVKIASVSEIAAMKAFSIGKRLSYKDYIDWHFLLKENHIDLKKVIALAQKKFNDDFNARLFLGQLVSLEDIPVQEIDFIRDRIGKDDLKKFLENTVRDFEL